MPFEPLFRNPHWQTIAGHYWRRPRSESRFPVQRQLIRTAPDVEVLVESQKPLGRAEGAVVMVHGLEGSSQAGYMRSLAAAALQSGFEAHRFNMRTCGGTERLCTTLYHGGLTSDLQAVLQQLRSEGTEASFLVGFSLGGNVVLKLAAELGDSAQLLLHGVCAVSAPLDLATCARRIAERDNRIYERRFVRRMQNRLLATGRYRRSQFAGLRSVMEMDDRITAPSFGFGNAAHYYRTQSAIACLDRLRVPALLIQAKDDTFIPFEIFQSQVIQSNQRIELLVTEHGGHLGFIGRRPNRFWADRAIMDWIQQKNAKEPTPVSSRSFE